MIYGQVVNTYSDKFLFSLNRLKKAISWPEGILHEIGWGNFSGGFILDPRLPYEPDDFIFIDYSNNQLVLMSGVIYNRSDLVDSLSLKNSKMHDPELISYAYKKWGESFVQKLNGDFVIFLFNKESNIAYLFRDHLGIRPAAYFHEDGILIFASDSLGLCKTLFGKEEVDRQFIENLLIKYGLQSTNIILEDYNTLPSNKVHKILAGHYVCFSDSVARDNTYWDPKDIVEELGLNFETMISEIRNLIVNSIKIRCDKRFIAATHLSGGLDSGIVAAIARATFNEQKAFLGFCWTPDKKESGIFDFDERALVKELGQFVGISPVFINANSDDYLNYLSDWMNVTDLFYEQCVLENATSEKINLIFSGWGGDEFLSLGDIGIDSDLLFKLKLRSFLKKNPIKKPRRIINTLVFSVILPALSLRFYSFKKPLTNYSKYLNLKGTKKAKTINDFFSWRSRREMQLRFFYQYHLQERTENWYINGMHNGIEYRFPLLDKRLIEYVLKIPSQLLFNNGYSRILIRETSEGILPEKIRWHVSKNDPVRIQALNNIIDTACEKLMEEISDFESNKELNFIDFELLKQDNHSYRDGHMAKRPSEAFEILFFLKKAHEFINKYHEPI